MLNKSAFARARVTDNGYELTFFDIYIEWFLYHNGGVWLKQIRIAICEEHTAYRERLAEYFIHRKSKQVKIWTFSDSKLFVKQNPVGVFDVVLWGKEFKKGIPKETAGTLYIFLSETPDWTEEYEPAIFKYQSAEEIWRRVFEHYLKIGKVDHHISRKEKEIIGIYSPTRSRMQTPFALTLAQVLGEDKRTLYVNFGEWSGFEGWLQESYRRDLSDLMYLLSDYGTQTQGLLECVVHSMERMDYIPPMADAQLLCQTKEEEYLRLLRFLIEKTSYDKIFLDFGIMVPGFYRMLDQCTNIYGIVDQSAMAKIQCRQFEESLMKSGMEHLAEKLDFITFTLWDEQILSQEPVLHQWMYSVLGDRARSVRYGNYAGTD